MRPIFPGLRRVGTDAERFRSPAVHRRVVEEESFVGFDAGVVEYELEDLEVGLLHVQFVGEVDAVEKVGGLVPFIAELRFFGPLPVEAVRVAQQTEVIMLAELQEPVELVGWDVPKHRNPGAVYFLVRQMPSRQSADAGAEGGDGDVAQLELHVQIFVLVRRGHHVFPDVADAQLFEGINPARARQVDQNASEVENNILYLAHNSISSVFCLTYI